MERIRIALAKSIPVPTALIATAPKLLNKKGAAIWEEFNVRADPARLSEMMQKTGGKKTIPQIFIALEERLQRALPLRNAKFDEMLKKSGGRQMISISAAAMICTRWIPPENWMGCWLHDIPNLPSPAFKPIPVQKLKTTLSSLRH